MVAFLRFASVYQAYDGLEDFEAAIAELRAERPVSEADGTCVPVAAAAP